MRWYYGCIGGVLMGLALLCGGDSGGVYANITPPALHGWIVYWDEQGGVRDAAQAKEEGRPFAGLSYFAASFDDEDRLQLPAQLAVDKAAARRLYLSVVNDVTGRTATLTKDAAVVRRVLADGDKRERHADDIIALAKEAGANGIEMDYERVWRDTELRRSYEEFLRLLYKKARRQGLAMRVVLEPSVDYGGASLPPGPTYVMMAYNLYGTHSAEPGPKADYAFLRRLAVTMNDVPSPKGMAFSLGGAYWDSEGTRKYITVATARRLAKEHGCEPRRDPLSGAWYFEYEAADGRQVTVWYGDRSTAEAWIKAVAPYGWEDISLWRLGEYGTFDETV